jgi:hypothetical protein
MNEELKKELFDAYCRGRNQAFDLLIDFLLTIRKNSEDDALKIFKELTIGNTNEKHS